MKPRQIYREYLREELCRDATSILRVEEDWEGVNVVRYIDSFGQEHRAAVCVQTFLVWMFKNLRFERRGHE